jgi:hypothetical protein
MPFRVVSYVFTIITLFSVIRYQQANRYFFEGCMHYANIFTKTGQSTAAKTKHQQKNV